MTLALALDGELPTEFRLFVSGWNETENGKFLFDAEAAKSVMAKYADWGIDLPIDLEHQMLDDPGADPTARDARGWCKLEVRSDGSLWAVQVRWTSDGAARLAEKRQRYVSPAFDVDPKSRRILKMINVAITALPATHKTPALVAASLKGKGMNPEHVKAALEALESGDAKGAIELLKQIVTEAATGVESTEGDAGAEDSGAEGVHEEEKVEDPKVVAASAEDDDEDDKPAKKAERKAMRALLCHMTGAPTMAEALATVKTYRESHLALETERTKLARDRATLEVAERRKLAADLVKIGAEFPSTIWVDAAATSKSLKPRWAKMPIAELRSHVADQRAARGARDTETGVKPPPGARTGNLAKLSAADQALCEELGLEASELAICRSTDCDPKNYAALKAFRDGKKAV